MRRPIEKRQREKNDCDKENSPPTKKSRSERAGNDIPLEDHSEQDYEVNLAKLNEELEKDRPSGKAVRRLMKDTFAGRRQWIRKEQPAIVDVLEKFPSLSKTKHVSSSINKFSLHYSCMYFQYSFAETSLLFLMINMSMTMQRKNGKHF